MRRISSAQDADSYTKMILFNAAVMEVGQSPWVSEVLASFGTIVTNAADAYCLQEEGDFLEPGITKCKGPISLGKYTAMMPASLRALAPKDRDAQRKVARSGLVWNVDWFAHSTLPAREGTVGEPGPSTWRRFGVVCVVSMALELYRGPKRMVVDTSAVGPRHVGHGAPRPRSGPSPRPARRSSATGRATMWSGRLSGGR